MTNSRESGLFAVTTDSILDQQMAAIHADLDGITKKGYNSMPG